MQETEKRPYAAQTWTEDLFASSGVFFLSIIEHDLIEDARANDVPLATAIEFWVNPGQHLKGLFMGDTTSLVDNGWTLLGTL